MRFRSVIVTANLLIMIILSVSTMAGINENVRYEPVILEKPATPLSQAAANFLNNQITPTVKVWVFFNDKEILSTPSFKTAAANVAINEHAAERRLKAGIKAVTFADIPVSQGYVDRITQLGAKFRRVSRWLNSASFEINKGLLEQIGQLPFVNRIEPVAGFKAVPDSASDIGAVQLKPNAADVLNYGISAGQLQMINVPALHNMGYKGNGVVVAMLDTGFRKSHQAFAAAFGGGRVLAEHDFIFNDGNTDNEAVDVSSQHTHGTYTWSTLGGQYASKLYGPAYGASFLLAKTEDVRSETPVEEDNWVAALEWADALGAEVISSSLGYSDWYNYTQMDGLTATITIAANTAAALGITVCNSMGNDGPNTGTLSAPADAFDILSCGAVDASRVIASFSSRGPTFDGRTKPEVCAMGVNTYCAGAGADDQYGYVSGTSLSTPLVGGAAALLLSANPALNPYQIRQAFMMTADKAEAPDNTYGRGIIDLLKAYNWGANFTADSILGYNTLNVHFNDSSSPAATSWKWYFGDGDSSSVQNPAHQYSAPGSYDVSLIIESADGALPRLKRQFIAVVADTLTFVSDSAYAGQSAVMPVNLKNTQWLDTIIIPVSFPAGMNIILDSALRGSRTVQFEMIHELYRDNAAHQVLLELVADNGGGTAFLAPGTGEIAQLYFTLDSLAAPDATCAVDTAIVNGRGPDLANLRVKYAPGVKEGIIKSRYVLRGDANNSGTINVLDVTSLINYLYKGGAKPMTIAAGDANSSLSLNVLDVTFLINYLYKGGPAPANP